MTDPGVAPVEQDEASRSPADIAWVEIAVHETVGEAAGTDRGESSGKIRDEGREGRSHVLRQLMPRSLDDVADGVGERTGAPVGQSERQQLRLATRPPSLQPDEDVDHLEELGQRRVVPILTRDRRHEHPLAVPTQEPGHGLALEPLEQRALVPEEWRHDLEPGATVARWEAARGSTGSRCGPARPVRFAVVRPRPGPDPPRRGPRPGRRAGRTRDGGDRRSSVPLHGASAGRPPAPASGPASTSARYVTAPPWADGRSASRSRRIVTSMPNASRAARTTGPTSCHHGVSTGKGGSWPRTLPSARTRTSVTIRGGKSSGIRGGYPVAGAVPRQMSLT